MASSSSTKLKHMLVTLGRALELEHEQWIPPLPADSQAIVIEGLRPRAIAWLTVLNDKFNFTPETLFLTVDICNRFLARVKAQPKYLKCISIACLYIAAKTNEEDEVIPTTMELVSRSQCGCSVAEILRMELCVLDKINWSVKASNTSFDFLHLIHSIVVSKCSTLLSADRCADDLRALDELMTLCLPSHDLLAYRPSTVALCVLALYLELTWVYWLPAIITLQALLRVGDDQASACRRIISAHLGPNLPFVIGRCRDNKLINNKQLMKNNNNDEMTPPNLCPPPSPTLYVCSSSQVLPPAVTVAPGAPPVTPDPPAKRRKVEQDDDVYDDIRKLYDCSSESSSSMMSSSCGSQMIQLFGAVPSASVAAR